MTEAQFKKKVVAFLKDMTNCDFFIKEAKTIRGIADIIGTYDGMPFHLELKKNREEAQKASGRIVLQRHRLIKAGLCGTYAIFLYPENFETFKIAFVRVCLGHHSGVQYPHEVLQERLDPVPSDQSTVEN